MPTSATTSGLGLGALLFFLEGDGVTKNWTCIAGKCFYHRVLSKTPLNFVFWREKRETVSLLALAGLELTV